MSYYHEIDSGGHKTLPAIRFKLIFDEIIYFLRHKPKPVF
jgi:hypothetical protein